MLYRAKQLVVIGDPLQLKHITSTTQSEESAIKAHLNINENPFVRNVDYSLWDYCNDLITSADSNCKRVMLDRHYRCHPQIIGYSNGMFYQRKLGTTLKVDTQEHHPEIQQRGIIWVDVVGTQRSETKNVNDANLCARFYLKRSHFYSPTLQYRHHRLCEANDSRKETITHRYTDADILRQNS